MLVTLTILLVFQLIGESISFALALPIPGPVIGMLLLFLFLQARPLLAQRMKDTSLTLLSHLSLLFVPAGVGIMLYLDRVRSEWLAISVSLLVSTAGAILVAAVTMRFVDRLVQARRQRRGAPLP